MRIKIRYRLYNKHRLGAVKHIFSLRNIYDGKMYGAYFLIDIGQSKFWHVGRCYNLWIKEINYYGSCVIKPFVRKNFRFGTSGKYGQREGVLFLWK